MRGKLVNDMTEIDRVSQEPMLFFKHDANASQDIKCQRLIHRRGWDGYGRWWRLCEYLAATQDHRIEFQTDEDALILSRVLGFGSGGAFDDFAAIEDCKSFIGTLVDVGLLKSDGDGFLYSNRMLDNARYFGRQKINGRKGGRPRKKQPKEVNGDETKTD